MNPSRRGAQVALHVEGMAGIVAVGASLAGVLKSGSTALEGVDHDIELGIRGSWPMTCFAPYAVLEGAGVGGVTGGALRIEGLLEAQWGRRVSVRRLLPGFVQRAMTGATRLAAEHREARVGSGHSSGQFAPLLRGPEGDRPSSGQDGENHYQARVYAFSAR